MADMLAAYAQTLNHVNPEFLGLPPDELECPANFVPVNKKHQTKSAHGTSEEIPARTGCEPLAADRSTGSEREVEA